MHDTDRRDGGERIAVVVPTLNEQERIGACLHSLLGQAEAFGATILVVDGGSSDDTRAIVAALAQSHAHLSLVDNPGRLQSAALNLAARSLPAGVSVLVRADAHVLYPPHFLATCVDALRHHRVTSVVVPMRAVGTTGKQRAIAATQNSRLGNGAAGHRLGAPCGLIEHGHHAAFDCAFFRQIGGYNECFSHNEDAEFDLRAWRAGGRIWMCRDAEVAYFPRASLAALMRQYLRHGAGRARTLLLHRTCPRLRQVAPPLLLAGLAVCAALTPLTIWMAALPVAYTSVCVIWALVIALRERDAWLLLIAPAAMTMHLAWAAGFWRGLFLYSATPRARVSKPAMVIQ
jgi:succinoglycan biosynthesis protein ExoA